MQCTWSDARAVAAGNRHRIAAGEHQVSRVEQQPDVVVRAGHQAVDFVFRLHDRTHVMVEGEPHAALLQVARDGVEFRAEVGPRGVGEYGAAGQRRRRVAIGAAMTFGEHHRLATHRRQKLEMRGDGRDLGLDAAAGELRAVPARDESESDAAP